MYIHTEVQNNKKKGGRRKRRMQERSDGKTLRGDSLEEFVHIQDETTDFEK